MQAKPQEMRAISVVLRFVEANLSLATAATGYLQLCGVKGASASLQGGSRHCLLTFAKLWALRR